MFYDVILILSFIIKIGEVIQMNIAEIIAYITIGYFFVTLTVLYLLSVSTSNIDKVGGDKSKEINTDEEFEEYRKAA